MSRPLPPNLTIDQLARELLRRDSDEFNDFYVPHKGQCEFHASPCREKWAITGNRWGKTTAVVQEVIWNITRTHPSFTPKAERQKGHWAYDWPERKPVRGKQTWRVVANDVGAFIKYLVPKFRHSIPRRYLYNHSWEDAWDARNNILLFEDGSVIQFMTYEQKIQAHEGETLHGVMFDEEPPPGIYTVNTKSLATTNGYVFGAMTPWQSSRFIYQDIYLAAQTSDRVFVVTGKMEDNPYTTERALKDIEDRLTDPAERAARLYGEFAWLTGAVFPEYKRDIHYVPYPAEGLPDDWPIVMVVDPHPNKPTFVLWVKFDLSNPDRPVAWAYREAALRGTVEEIANQIRIMSSNEIIDTMLIDAHVLHPDALRGTASLMMEWQRLLPGIAPAPADKNKRINIMKEYFQVNPINNEPRCFITHNCPGTHWQIERYHWKGDTRTGEETSKPQTIKKDDDWVDCLGYALQVGPKRRRRPKAKPVVIGFKAISNAGGYRTY